MFQQRKKFGCGTGRITGSFIPFLFSLGWFYFRETVFRGKVVPVILPDAGKEIIKSPDTGSIPERETAEDGIKRGFPEHAAPDRDGSYFQFQSKQIGAKHAGRKTGLRAKNRVTFLHNGISQGEIQIPELHDKIPGAFWKCKGREPSKRYKTRFPACWFGAEYPKVLQLSEKGYLKSNVVKGDRFADKAVYSITDKGRKYFNELMSTYASESIPLLFDFNVVIGKR